jgi:hypothetical protein
MMIRLCLLAALALPQAALATPLDLTLPLSPDIMSGFIDVTFDASSDTLEATGFALTLDGAPISNGTFLLIVDLAAISGTLDIGGNVGGSGPSLLTGDLTAFGFIPGGGDPLEFTFSATGGDLLSLFGGLSAPIGVILSGTGFPGDFAADFDNRIGLAQGTGSGVADAAAVPEAGTAVLLLLGGFGLATRRAGRIRRTGVQR